MIIIAHEFGINLICYLNQPNNEKIKIDILTPLMLKDKKILFPKTHKAIINTACSIPLTARH